MWDTRNPLIILWRSRISVLPKDDADADAEDDTEGDVDDSWDENSNAILADTPSSVAT
jgi:hypothetical protein